MTLKLDLSKEIFFKGQAAGLHWEDISEGRKEKNKILNIHKS